MTSLRSRDMSDSNVRAIKLAETVARGLRTTGIDCPFRGVGDIRQARVMVPNGSTLAAHRRIWCCHELPLMALPLLSIFAANAAAAFL